MIEHLLKLNISFWGGGYSIRCHWKHLSRVLCPKSYKSITQYRNHDTDIVILDEQMRKRPKDCGEPSPKPNIYLPVLTLS